MNPSVRGPLQRVAARARGGLAALIGAACLAAGARAGAATEAGAVEAAPARDAGAAAVREDAVAGHLRVIEASGSLGPGPRAGVAPFVAARPRALCAASADEGPGSGCGTAAVGAPIPASVDSVLPGDCIGGPHPGAPCLEADQCGNGGMCHFFRVEVYRNEGGVGFNSPSNPRTALDDLVLAGTFPTPPARITSFEVAYVVTGNGVPAGNTLRIEVRLWDDLDPAAPAGTPVPSGLLGGAFFLVPGPIAAGPQLFVGTIPSGMAIAPDDPAIGYQLDFRDDASGAFAYATPFFYGQGVQTGSSGDIYWRDANANGLFDASDARQFGGAPTLANFYAHLGAENPTSETEPNGSQGTATVTAPCLALAATISPVGDVDWYRFTLSAPQTIQCEARCVSASDDSTLTLRDGAGSVIEFNDDAGPGNHSSKILRSLAAGTYYMEIHEKNDDAQIPLYQAYVGPMPPQVVNLHMAANKHAISWDPVTSGAPYDILFGSVSVLHGSGFGASVGGCLGSDLADPVSDDSDTPAPGDGFWYLARSRDPCAGGASTYDEGGAQIGSRDQQVPPPPIDCSRP